MSSRVHDILDELRQRFSDHYGRRLLRMVLFGSQARGDAVADSDIDVLVVLQDPVDPVAEIFATGQMVSEVSLQFTSVVSCVFAGKAQFAAGNEPLLRNIHREGIVV